MSEAHERSLQKLEQISDWMDRRYVDPILGMLVPGAGDALGALVGLYGVKVALRIGAHPMVIARMLINLTLDALFGAVPIIGLFGDFFFRAHLRNVELLRNRRADGARPGDYAVVALAALAFVTALILPIVAAVFVITWVVRALGS